MAPSTAQAVVQRNGSLLEETVTLPSLGPHQMLVDVNTAAFNPTDGQSFAINAFGDGAVLGCDFSGIVTEIGSGVTKFKVGDSVAALVWGGEVPGLGAYSTRCIADEEIAFKIPDGMSWADAATIPLAANTSYLALFSEDSLHMSRDKGEKQKLLIWGGASTVGVFALQLAKQFGIETLTTCSPKNFDHVKSLGAKYAFDYNDPDVISKIQSAAPDLKFAFDTIGNPSSSPAAGKACSSHAARLCTVRPGKSNCEDVPANVTVTDVFVFTAFLKPHSYQGMIEWPVLPEHHSLSADFYAALPDYIESGVIRPHTVKDMGKLSPSSLKQAMDLVESGKISNEKMCFKVLKS